MTRRERMKSLVGRFDEKRRRWELDGLLAKHGLDALSDEALDELASRCVRGYRRSQEMNRRNRERMQNLRGSSPYDDDPEEEECFHEEADLDILTGRMTCNMCDHRWYASEAEMKRHADLMAQPYPEDDEIKF